MLNKRHIFIATMILVTTLVYGLLNTALISAQGSAPQAAASSQWCKGVNIVFFPGGTPGGPFESVVYAGAVQATADLGPTTQYVWSDWDVNKMVTQLDAAQATHPDGIAIMGHPGDDAYKAEIDKAEKAGIIITAQNVPLSVNEAAYKTNGFGYVGAELLSQGMAVGNEAIKEFGLKSGDEVMVWGLLAQPGRGQRTKGVEDALTAAGIKVDDLEIDDATQKDVTAGIPTFTGFISSHPNVKAVIIDHGNLTASIPNFLQAAGKKPGDIKAAGFDLSAATVKGIQDGWIGFVNDQQEYLQGYLPILQICLTKKFGFTGLHVDTGAGFVTKDNIAMVAPLAQQGIR